MNNKNKLEETIKNVLNDFVFESKDKSFKLSNIVDGEIRVSESKLRELFGKIGEGIESIDVYSESLSGKSNIKTDEFQNEITIYFYENAWGGIDFNEWSKLDVTLAVMENRANQDNQSGFDSYTINPSRNLVVLNFIEDYPMGLYK